MRQPAMKCYRLIKIRWSILITVKVLVVYLFRFVALVKPGRYIWVGIDSVWSGQNHLLSLILLCQVLLYGTPTWVNPCFQKKTALAEAFSFCFELHVSSVQSWMENLAPKQQVSFFFIWVFASDFWRVVFILLDIPLMLQLVFSPLGLVFL